MKSYKIVASTLIGALVACVTVAPAMADDNAVIKGKVIFKGDAKAQAFRRTKLDRSKDANCAKEVKKIGSEHVVLNTKTDPVTVRNVLVYVKEGLGDRTYKAPEESVVLNQYGCQYKPHIVALMEGQELIIRNSDDTNHNIHFHPKKNKEINKTQPQPTDDMVKLVAEDVFRVNCDVHPWMGCYIGVYTHPFFAVTGKDGTFELKGLPPGKYVIEAWHETFGTQTATIEVAIDETKEYDFTFAPGE